MRIEVSLEPEEEAILEDACICITGWAFKKPVNEVTNIDVVLMLAGVLKGIGNKDLTAHNTFFNMLRGFLLSCGISDMLDKIPYTEVYLILSNLFKETTEELLEETESKPTLQ